MPRTGIVLLFFLLFVSQAGLSQQDKAIRKEIYKLIFKADSLLNQLKFKESLQVSKKALNMAYKNKQYDYVAMSYNTIAGCQEELLETKKALDYYQKALSYAEKAGDDTLKDWINNNIGNIYNFDLKDFDKSIYYYQKSLAYAEKTKDTTEIIFTKLNLAWAHFNRKEFPAGYAHLNFIEKYIGRYGDKESNVILNNLFGTYYSSEGNVGLAESYFKKSIELGIKYKQQKALAEAYEQYAKHLFNNEDFKTAYLVQSQYEKLKDEIRKNEKLKSAQVAGIQIELDESKREIDAIEREKEKNLKNSEIIAALFLAAFCILLLLLYTFYRNNVFRKKINKQLTESNAALKIAKEKAEESSKLKSQFISTVTHELRTPLYGVTGITDIILEEHPELEKSPHINSLKFSAKYLLSLVNDLLQIHKIEDRKIVLEKLPLNVSDEIEKVNQALQFIAIKNGNKIYVEVDPLIPEYLIGDKLRLSQILVNLTSNALKFTKNGVIRIIATLEKTAGSLNYVRFQIIDNGYGIAAENQDKIFEKFVQIDRKEGDYQGTGLGLAIVKKLLELLGSSIELESRENSGTKVSFAIPFEYDEEATLNYIYNIEVDAANSESYRILVVEDNKINQIVTRKIIEKNNFECLVADDGYAAMEILEKEIFDIILMDINMPVINGFETAKMIRDKGIKTPIIALTAYDKDEISSEAALSGMNDILIKPFEPVKLFNIISKQIALANSQIIKSV
ncbi:MAG TPA: response regulator [Flavobacterium sp.]|nr:response regulator [Flavobacterium sp.]